MWGTVENLALGSSKPRDVPAVGCIHIPEGEVSPCEVFIAFGGTQGDDDRLVNLWRIVNPPRVGRTPWSAADPPVGLSGIA
jgi:hypothetical protein